MLPGMKVFCQLHCTMWLTTEMSSCQEESNTILNTHCRKIKIENDREERRDEILFFMERKQVVTEFSCYMKSYLNLISWICLSNNWKIICWQLMCWHCVSTDNDCITMRGGMSVMRNPPPCFMPASVLLSSAWTKAKQSTGGSENTLINSSMWNTSLHHAFCHSKEGSTSPQSLTSAHSHLTEIKLQNMMNIREEFQVFSKIREKPDSLTVPFNRTKPIDCENYQNEHSKRWVRSLKK